MGVGGFIKGTRRWDGKSVMDTDYEENVWIPLKEAIKMILVRKPHNMGECLINTEDDTTMDDSFDTLYKTSYLMVNDNHAKSLYDGVREILVGHLETEVLPLVLQSLNNKFLDTVDKAWLDHQASLEMIRDGLLYLDRSGS